MLLQAWQVAARFHQSARRCSLHVARGTRRPMADSEQIHKEEVVQKWVNTKQWRYLTAVPLEQLAENVAFWLRQFGFTNEDFAKLARVSPQAFSIDASSLAARWATLKQVLGWDDHQCKEALAKDMKISYVNYGNQYVVPETLRGTVDALLELGIDSSDKDRLVRSERALRVLSRSRASITAAAAVLVAAGYPRSALPSIFLSGFPRIAASTFAQSLAYVRDVMGRRLLDSDPTRAAAFSVSRTLAPRYTALHKAHGAALDDVPNVHMNTQIFVDESRFLKYGRITREVYDEVRRLTVPRFVVLWEEREPLPPPDVALIEGDEAFLQRVGRADLLPKLAAMRAEAQPAKEEKRYRI